MIRVSDLKVQEVVDVSSGTRLGYVSDVEVDLENGYVTALILPGDVGLRGLFSRANDIVIPWDRIVKIGADLILVEIEELGGFDA